MELTLEQFIEQVRSGKLEIEAYTCNAIDPNEMKFTLTGVKASNHETSEQIRDFGIKVLKVAGVVFEVVIGAIGGGPRY